MNRTGMAAAAALWGAVLIVAVGMAPAYAANECGGLVLRDKNGEVREPNRFQDRSLFVREAGKRNWTFVDAGKSFDEVGSLVDGGRTSRLLFLYLSKGREGDRGVVVVKAGELVPDDGLASERRVQLSRPAVDAATTGGCETQKPEFHSSVLGEAYDRYHDFVSERDRTCYFWFFCNSSENRRKAQFTGSITKLRDFHITYQSIRKNSGGCLRTDQATGNDPNRAKFSFDEGVKSNGFRPKVALLRRSWAATEGDRMRMRQVHMAPYSLGDSGAACLQFRLKISEKTFLYIDDLEK
jgi:hypothetical protein